MKLCWCSETVVFTIGLALVALHAALEMRPMVRKSRMASCAAMFKRLVRATLNIFKQVEGVAAPKGLEKFVYEKLLLRRLASARVMYSTVANIVFVSLLTVLWNVALGRPRWMTPLQDAMLLILFAYIEFCRIRPAPTECWLNINYGCIMLTAVVFSVSTSLEHISFSIGTAFVIRILVSALHMETTTAMLWNVIAVCANVLCIHQHAQYRHSSLGEMVYIIEGVLTVALLMSVHSLRTWTVVSVRQDFIENRLRMENSASLLMLDMACDVVVRLANDLTFAQDSQTFAALLMRTSSASLEGSSLCEFIKSPDDQDIFRDKALALEIGLEPSVGSCRVEFSDSLQQPIHAELMFVKVGADCEDCQYLVGIRELTDAAPMEPFAKLRSTKKSVAMLSKGTPSNSEHVILEPKKEPLSQSAWKTSHLRFGHLAPTLQAVMLREIIATMVLWNVEIPRTTCCSFHAYVLQLKEALKQFQKMECMEQFPAYAPSGLQCQECGLFDAGEFEEPQCCFCKSRDFKVIPSQDEKTSL